MDFIATQTQLPDIKTNFNDVKKYVEAKRDMYKGVIVTEDTLKECRADLSDLIRIRNNIEDFRKAKKKEMTAPITAFEKQCKMLVEIIGEAENPLSDGIKVFDTERKEQKRKQAEELIQKAIAEKDLRDKFAKKLIIKDEYLLLTASKKSVREAIAAEADRLLNMQISEDADIEAIKSSVERENKDLMSKLDENEFIKMIEVRTVADILGVIAQRAAHIREAQKLAEERIKKQIEEARVNVPPVVGTGTNMKKDTAPSTVSPALAFKQMQDIPVNNPFVQVCAPTPEQWCVSLNITGSFEQLAAFNRYLKENNIQYQVISQNKITS